MCVMTFTVKSVLKVMVYHTCILLWIWKHSTLNFLLYLMHESVQYSLLNWYLYYILGRIPFLVHYNVAPLILSKRFVRIEILTIYMFLNIKCDPYFINYQYRPHTSSYRSHITVRQLVKYCCHSQEDLYYRCALIGCHFDTFFVS